MIIRVCVHVLGASLALWVFMAEPVALGGPLGPAMDRTLWFGLFASVFLYAALLISPLLHVFARVPRRQTWIAARRALGIQAALFGGLHGWYGFIGWVGGMEGLKWWSWDYQLSLLLGTLAFLILALLALTSFDLAVARLRQAWKRLHRLVYAAGVLIVAHAAMVTIHVVNLQPFLYGWFAALAGLGLLEFNRIRVHVTGRRLWLASGVFAAGMAALYWSTFLISHHRH